jgi:MOSC domain-containing protein YiiM
MNGMGHADAATLHAGLDHVLASPSTTGEVRLLVVRPAASERTSVAEARIDTEQGVTGDNWLVRGSKRTVDGSADPHAQVTVMNIRAAELVAREPERVPLAGDQIYVDFDISHDNLPAGALLAVGDAVLRVSEKPHTGCAKFVDRFGAEAMRFVNSRTGRQLRLRGVNTSVVTPGVVRVGSEVRVADS